MDTQIKETLYTSDECDIFYLPELHAIMSVWKGIYVEGEKLREIFNELINGLEKKKTSIIVADAREMKIISYEDQQWTIDNWYPRAVNAGFRNQGLILTHDTFNEVAVKKISRNYDDAVVTTHYFETPSEALEWARYVHNLDSPPYPGHHFN
jgi:hypothetical protein